MHTCLAISSVRKPPSISLVLLAACRGLPRRRVQLRYDFHGYSHGSKTFGGYIPITSDIAMSLPICEPHVILVIVYRQRSRVDLALWVARYLSEHQNTDGEWTDGMFIPLILLETARNLSIPRFVATQYSGHRKKTWASLEFIRNPTSFYHF